MATTIPGGVVSNIVGSTSSPMSIQDQATAYSLQQRMKEDKEREWANAAAQNNARMAQAVNLIYKPSSGQRPQPTFTTGSTVAGPSAGMFPTMPGFQGPVNYVDRGSPTLGWDVERATKRAAKAGDPIPLFITR